MQQKNVSVKKYISYILIGLACFFVAFVIIYNHYYSYRQNNLELKSRYTYSIRIDSNYNVVDSDNPININENYYDFANADLSEIGKTWIKSFTGQFMQKYVPLNKKLNNVNISGVKIIDDSDGTVLISFSADVVDKSSDFFSSWDGVMDDNTIKCEWVVSFYVDNNYDDTAFIYVTDIMTPEEYGIAQYNTTQNTAGQKEITTNSSTDALAKYQIKNDTLLITYDSGDTYVDVPVSTSLLMYESDNDTSIQEGSYMITTTMTAFVYGGTNSGSSKIPVSVIFSNDKGNSWTTCELEKLYNASYYYINFFDSNNGVIVCGYAKTGNISESSKIYATSDGGDSWTTLGSGPASNIIKGVIYLNENTGFFCYNYVDGMDSNLYKTTDGGKTFSKMILEEQELDSTAKSSDSSGNSSSTSESELKWSDVYKEALVPVLDSNNILTIYLTQGESKLYNDGKTAAKYQSSDNGTTWKYVGQVEINKSVSSN